MEQLSVSNHSADIPLGSASPIQQKAAELANRLRLLQIDLVALPVAERQGHMTEALERGLASLTPEHRRQVVELLMERFPSWDANVQIGGPAAAAAPVQSPTDAAELKDPSFLLARLLELAPKMTPAQKQSAAAELKRAGFAVQSEGGLPESSVKSLQTVLGHTAREQVDPGRAVEMAAVLADVVFKLDALITTIWKRVAPNSSIKKMETLRVTLSRFAAGDKDTARPQVEAEVALLRQVTAGLVNAIKPAAPRITRKHLERFGAAEIERVVREEGGGWGIEGKCWKRYQQLCASMDMDAAERELLAIIAEEAERVMRPAR